MKVGNKFEFHGAFSKKANAKRKERKVGGFIRRTKIRGHVRYLVLVSKES